MNAAPDGGRLALVNLWVVLAFALVFSVWRAASGDPLTRAIEARLLDLRFAVRGAVAPPDRLTLVVIDEATVERFGWTPPPRRAIADAITRVKAADPAVIAIDHLFLEDTTEGPRLAAALAPGAGIVLAVALLERRDGRRDAPATLAPETRVALERSALSVVSRATQAAPPPTLLAPAQNFLSGVSLAHVNIARAPDRIARRVPLALALGDGLYIPAMGLEAARRIAGLDRGAVILSAGRELRFGPRTVPVDRANRVVLNHYGGAGAIATVSLRDVVEGRVPAERFRGRAVLFGASAPSVSDLFATPLAADVPGVEIIATLAANLVEDRLIRRDDGTRAVSIALALAAAGLIYAALCLPGLATVFVAVPAIWLASGAALQAAFSAGLLWLDAVSVLAALALATPWCVAARIRRQRRVAAQLGAERANLSRFVAPALVDRLAAAGRPDFDERAQMATMLYVDVAGYTGLTEALSPDQTATMLRALHRLYEDAVAAHGGLVVGFEGDGAMIVFGLPDPGSEDAARAVDCAMDLLIRAERFAPPMPLGDGLRLRISIHHGPVTAAVLGGARQAQVTVSGDAVNVASRLQEVAKEVGVQVVISRAARDAARLGGSVATERFHCLAERRLRGRRQTIEVWALDASGRP